MKAITEIFSYH